MDSLRSIMTLKNGILAATARNQSFRNRPSETSFMRRGRLTASDGACRHASFPSCGLRAVVFSILAKITATTEVFSSMGVVGDAGRAEIRAAIQMMHWSWCPTERQATLDGLKRIERVYPARALLMLICWTRRGEFGKPKAERPFSNLPRLRRTDGAGPNKIYSRPRTVRLMINWPPVATRGADAAKPQMSWRRIIDSMAR